MGTPFDFLKPTNQWLETVPINTIAAFDNMIGTGEDIAQEKVDIICTWLAWKVNIMIERKRQVLLKKLYGMYMNTVGGKVMQMAMAIKGFIKDPLGSIGTFASALGGPVPKVIAWGAVLLKELPRLAENLAKIVSALPPTPPNPNINYDKFKLKIKSISMGDITSDPNSLPAPEVIFPEPTKPFSKESFALAFEQVSRAFKSAKTKIVLSDTNKKFMDSIAKNTSVSKLMLNTEDTPAKDT